MKQDLKTLHGVGQIETPCEETFIYRIDTLEIRDLLLKFATSPERSAAVPRVVSSLSLDPPIMRVFLYVYRDLVKEGAIPMPPDPDKFRPPESVIEEGVEFFERQLSEKKYVVVPGYKLLNLIKSVECVKERKATYYYLTVTTPRGDVKVEIKHSEVFERKKPEFPKSLKSALIAHGGVMLCDDADGTGFLMLHNHLARVDCHALDEEYVNSLKGLLGAAFEELGCSVCEGEDCGWCHSDIVVVGEEVHMKKSAVDKFSLKYNIKTRGRYSFIHAAEKLGLLKRRDTTHKCEGKVIHFYVFDRRELAYFLKVEDVANLCPRYTSVDHISDIFVGKSAEENHGDE